MTFEKLTAMSYFDRNINEKGVVLVTALLFMAIITIAGTSAYFTSSNELQISGNYKRMKQSFYDSEAGVTYTLAVIENDLALGNITLTNATETITNYSAPTGYSFTPVTTLTQVSANTYSFQVTGNEGGSSATLEVVFERGSLLSYAVFGDAQLDLPSSLGVHSYDSGTTPNPTPSDTTNEADVGSNGAVFVDLNTEIDGNVILGNATDGTEAVLTEIGTPIIHGSIQDKDRQDPDPLGASGGDLANDFTNYAASNDNLSAGIAGTSVNITSGDTVSMTTGNYYFTDVTVNSGATLDIDATGGPVNIYLSGPLSADFGSSVNITGLPANVTIYSDTAALIAFSHNNDFKGTIYAPYSDIFMMNQSDIYGSLWGASVFTYNSGDFYYDTSLKNKWMADTVTIVSWRDTRYH